VGYDSGHGVMTAWSIDGEDSSALRELWRRDQNHAAHSLLYPESGELMTFDFDVARSMEQCVVLDIDSGEELGRVDTGSSLQSVLFPCPGWERDFYTLTFSTLTHIAVH
jgi:hypothetical protein